MSLTMNSEETLQDIAQANIQYLCEQDAIEIIQFLNKLILIFGRVKIFNIKTKSLNLSTRSSNILRYQHILTIGDLVQKSEKEMLEIHNFGRKCLNELKAVLKEMGLSFGMNLVKKEEINIGISE